MLRTTLSLLRCVFRKNCGSELVLNTSESPSSPDVEYGSLSCPKCKTIYPVLAGVAIVVPKVREYLLAHVKGISKHVPDDLIPKEFRKEYLAYRKQLASLEGFESDLESDRVNALYLMNHYLSAEKASHPWWQSGQIKTDPLIESLILKHWDQGPFECVKNWVAENPRAVELGCGVGGLWRQIRKQVQVYLGIDNAFQSIILARHLNLGIPLKTDLKIPSDLLLGSLSQIFPFESPHAAELSEARAGLVDFIVGEIEAPPIAKGIWDLSLSLNTIDMLEDPKTLAQAQFSCLKAHGVAIQSGPYIWNDQVSQRLRNQLPKQVVDSASAVTWIYEKAGFQIVKTQDHVPWIFFKHVRQIELYSVHLLFALKK